MHSYVCVSGGSSMLISKSFPLRNFQMSPSPRNVEFSCKASMIELIIIRFTGLMFSVSLEISQKNRNCQNSIVRAPIEKTAALFLKYFF